MINGELKQYCADHERVVQEFLQIKEFQTFADMNRLEDPPALPSPSHHQVMEDEDEPDYMEDEGDDYDYEDDDDENPFE